MRQGQQNRRGRGRNRKSQNPLSRSFESNGPDVKIRGTPAHIAEKYISLARDAQSSGDPVLAENYLQHAEHYSRIIMAYREQMHQAGEGYNGNGQQRLRGPNEGGEGGDDFGEDDADDLLDEGGFPQPSFQARRSIPNHTRKRANMAATTTTTAMSDPSGGIMGASGIATATWIVIATTIASAVNGNPSTAAQQPQPERPEPAADAGPPQQEQPTPPAAADPRRRERFQPQQTHEQPEFLRRPVRRARNEEETPDSTANGNTPTATQKKGPRASKRSRAPAGYGL